MTRLNNKRILWIVKNVSAGKATTSDVALIYGISQRRAQQIMKEYRNSGKATVLRRNRRPRTQLTEDQKQAIDEAWEQSRLSPRLLYWELRHRGHSIPKNKTYQYLKETGRSKPNPKKQKQRKRCRYERQHSLSLVHSDWLEHNGKQVIAFEDDASRRILAIGEFANATIENAISVIEEAMARASEVNARILQLNTHRGTQFFDNKVDKRGRKRIGKFEEYLKSAGIEHVPSRRHNPQTNGKMERWFQEYIRHRDRFASANAFGDWYNNRLHGALWLEHAETPNQAFQRKLRQECMIWHFCQLTGG